MNTILKIENLSKQYRLGLVGTGTLSHDLNRWWASVRGKEDPYLKVGDVNDRGTKATSEYVWALRDINFEVQQGEVLGIIGKNGAGKSTLLKILSKITAPTTGSVKSRGRIASLLEVGTGFHGEMTGRENIFLNGAILGMTKAEITAKLDEIIEFSGCERYIDTPVKRYSSGMTVRLAFAVAAFLEPDILIIDEVLAVGDAEFQKKAIGKMQDISRGEGRTVLFVSHNMAAVKSLCTRGLVLENGGIVFEGDVNEAVNKYLLVNQDFDNFDLLFIDEEFVKLENFTVNKSLPIHTGNEVIIEFSLENKGIDLVSYFNFEIKNMMGVMITSLSNEFINEAIITTSNQKVQVSIRVNNFLIAPGIYNVNFFYTDNKLNKYIYNKDFFSFEIFEDDIFKNGMLPNSIKHGFLISIPEVEYNII